MLPTSWIFPLILYFVISSFHFVHNIQSTKLIAVSNQCLQICHHCFSMEMPSLLWRYYKNIYCTNGNTFVLKRHVAVHKESHVVSNYKNMVGNKGPSGFILDYPLLLVHLTQSQATSNSLRLFPIFDYPLLLVLLAQSQATSNSLRKVS